MKKTSFTELFYLTLLFTALRPPDHSFYPPERALWHGSADSIGSIITENISSDFGNRYTDPSGGFANELFNSKSNILLRETLEVLEDLNSLGRYSQLLHNSNLFAFPVSRSGHDDSETTQTVVEDSYSETISDLFNLTDFNIPSPLFNDIEVSYYF